MGRRRVERLHATDFAETVTDADVVLDAFGGWRDSGWTEIRSANKDPDFRNRAKITDLEFGWLIRNVYKVLLTRGMIGTIIYSPDAETRDLLGSLIR